MTHITTINLVFVAKCRESKSDKLLKMSLLRLSMTECTQK
jgi:hypothetical protein